VGSSSEYFKVVDQKNCIRLYIIVTTLNHKGKILKQNKTRLLTAFPARHYVLAFIIISNRFAASALRFEARFSLTRLVEAEIVSPYCGISINAGSGNPTMPLARPLGNRQILKLEGRSA
jgi:hypothetical protein